jgi:hypothetical protein
LISPLGLLARLRRWMAGGRPVLEIAFGHEGTTQPPVSPGALTCELCGTLYLPRPREAEHPLNLCLACAAKETKDA